MDRTLGHTLIDENTDPECLTLEPPADKRIPPGRYELKFFESEKFHWADGTRRYVPQLQGVAGRSSIEIHILNFPNETTGCIGVGQSYDKDKNLLNSKIAFDQLMCKLFEAQFFRGEENFITIS